MKKILQCSFAALVIALLSGCAGAAFNSVRFTAVRNVTVGEELIKLQEAHDKQIISDEEYEQARQAALDLLNEFDGMEID